MPDSDTNPDLTRPCPNCGAEAGEHCTTTMGAEMPKLVHQARKAQR